MKVALSFIAKLQPIESTQVQLVPNENDNYNNGGLNAPVNYSFRFVRIVNGIPAPFDGFLVTVNGNGDIANYQFHWSHVTFADASNVVGMDKANQVYAQSLNLQRMYQPVWNHNDSSSLPTMRLIYSPVDTNMPMPYYNGMSETLGNPLIDARTGDVVDQTDTALSSSAITAVPQPLAPGQPDQPPQKLATALTSDAAENIAKNFVGIDSSYTLNNSSYNHWGSADAVWSFSWSNANNQSINISVDALTGQVRNFNEFTNPPTTPPSGQTAITQDQAKQDAINYVEKTFSTRLGVLYFKSINSNRYGGPMQPLAMKTMPQQYNVTFGELINGVIANQNMMNIQVDAYTGKVVGYNSSLDIPGNYPAPANLIGVDKANSLWLTHNPLTLEYMLPEKTDQTGPQSQAVPIYATNQNNNGPSMELDAMTGEWFYPYSTPASGESHIANDINGNWAQKQLQILIDRGVLDVTDGKVHPNGTVSEGDFLKYMARAFQPYGPIKMASQANDTGGVTSDNPYYPYVVKAILSNWIDGTQKIDLNAAVNREWMATLLVRVLGDGELAKHSEVFQLPYKDAATVPDSDKGSVAIAYALGIMRGDNGNFDPSGNITIAQLATAFVNTEKAMSMAVTHPYY